MDDFNEIINFIKFKKEEMYKNFNRVLPSNEYFSDRWEKSKYLRFGEGSSVYDTSIIMGNVKVGENCWIGPYTMLEGINGEITIGNNCSISTGVHIYTHDAALNVVSGGKAPFKKGNVIIGNNTYIGSMSLVKQGVVIGDKCIIGANTLVNKSIPSYSVAFGSPAKIVGKVIINDDDVKIEYF